jgi:hypothetical protein
MVSRRYEFECVLAIAMVLKNSSHNEDIDMIDCAFSRASRMPALKHKLYHKLDNVALFCLATNGESVDV